MSVLESIPEPWDSEDSVDFEEVSIEMSVDMVAALNVAGFQRRSLGHSEVAICDLVREAVSEWLEREIDGTSTVSIRI